MTQKETEATRIVRQIDALVDTLQDATLLLTGTLEGGALEEAAQLVDEAAGELEQAHASLCALLNKEQP